MTNKIIDILQICLKKKSKELQHHNDVILQTGVDVSEYCKSSLNATSLTFREWMEDLFCCYSYCIFYGICIDTDVDQSRQSRVCVCKVHSPPVEPAADRSSIYFSDPSYPAPSMQKSWPLIIFPVTMDSTDLRGNEQRSGLQLTSTLYLLWGIDPSPPEATHASHRFSRPRNHITSFDLPASD